MPRPSQQLPFTSECWSLESVKGKRIFNASKRSPKPPNAPEPPSPDYYKKSKIGISNSTTYYKIPTTTYATPKSKISWIRKSITFNSNSSSKISKFNIPSNFSRNINFSLKISSSSRWFSRLLLLLEYYNVITYVYSYSCYCLCWLKCCVFMFFTAV